LYDDAFEFGEDTALLKFGFHYYQATLKYAFEKRNLITAGFEVKGALSYEQTVNNRVNTYTRVEPLVIDWLGDSLYADLFKFNNNSVTDKNFTEASYLVIKQSR
jgi:hypothetical protein